MKLYQTHPWKLLGKTVKLTYRGNAMDSSPVFLTGVYRASQGG